MFDDGDKVDLTKISMYDYLFKMMNSKDIRWKVIFGDGVGQVKNHQIAIDMVKTDWIWRLDDDNIVEPDALQKLLEAAGDTNGGVGAVGGCIFHGQRSEPPKLAMTKIENTFFNAGNIQWYYGTKRMELDTLYSTFIYSVEAAKQIGGYCMELSPVGHREETIFTYELKRHGWKLIFEPKAVTWHLRENTGGIRSWKGEDNYRHDDEIFKRKL